MKKKMLATLTLVILAALTLTVMSVSAAPAEGAVTANEWNTPEARAATTMTIDEALYERACENNPEFRMLDGYNRRVLPFNNEIAIAFELEVFRLINVERANHGLPPFVWNDERAINSRVHAMNKATVGHLSHDHRGLSRQLGTCHLWVGYGPTGGNSAAGQHTPEQAVQSWMNSPGHRAWFLDPNMASIGVGITQSETYRLYWYTMFEWGAWGVPNGISEADLFASLGVPLAPNTTPNQTPAPQPTSTPTPQPPAANTEATTTITHTGHRVAPRGNETVQITYTRTTFNGRDGTRWTCGSGRALSNSVGINVPFTFRNEGNVLVITNRATGETFRLNRGEQVTLHTTQSRPIQQGYESINFGQIAGRVSVGEFGQITIPVTASNIPDGVYQAAFWFDSGTPGVGFVDGLSIQGFSPNAINIGRGVYTYAVGEIRISDGRGTLILINDGSASWTRRYWNTTLYISLNGTWIHAAGRINVA
ncbi:MAG: CAP domain-containing protein [Defluviitaleaceae bacterium]|nr:CAP domain-containing protein [Defluviitaleaceae bacterium]